MITMMMVTNRPMIPAGMSFLPSLTRYALLGPWPFAALLIHLCRAFYLRWGDSRNPPIACLIGDVGERLRLEAAGGEVIAHLLVGGLYEPRIVEELLDLVGRGVAADVLF